MTAKIPPSLNPSPCPYKQPFFFPLQTPLFPMGEASFIVYASKHSLIWLGQNVPSFLSSFLLNCFRNLTVVQQLILMLHTEFQSCQRTTGAFHFVLLPIKLRALGSYAGIYHQAIPPSTLTLLCVCIPFLRWSCGHMLIS